MTYYPNVNLDENVSIINGGFDIDANWLKGIYWGIGGGLATIMTTGAELSYLSQAPATIIKSNVYDISFTISNSTWDAGNGIAIVLGGDFADTIAKENGRYTIRVKCGNLNTWLLFGNKLNTIGVGCSIDNVLIKAIGTDFFNNFGIDHRTVRGAVRYQVPDGDHVYHALSYKDKTNCLIKYTP